MVYRRMFGFHKWESVKVFTLGLDYCSSLCICLLIKYGILFLIIFKMYAMYISVIVCFMCFDIFQIFLFACYHHRSHPHHYIFIFVSCILHL